MTTSLKGKTAIVTGASSGIGKATALSLARAGASVVVTARRKGILDELVAEIMAQGGNALAVPGDAGNPADIDTLLEQTLNWGGGGNKYDIVVANAGRGLAGGVLDSDESQWQALYQTNVLGVSCLLKRVGKHLVQQKHGDIVVVGSVVGRNISPFSGFYGSSKFAVGALAEALRREVCASGVRVSLVLPGMVESGFQDVAGYTKEGMAKMREMFGQLLDPQNIADSIQWLLSLPSHVNVNEITVRPTGQSYP
jgi:NADP-dependent 3-hydroxy acid dehydrogenase YdfG